ncbi:MAG: N-acetylmuramoyl-L-alanine amidase [Synergistaceae bacterium]|nr:N-acetylmuramoyl-L-alanine amidase [Synergistaceae bacterium]
MKKIAAFCIPAHGHTNPMLPVVAELVRRGDEVRFYSFGEFREKIEGTGAAFISCDAFLPELNAREEAGLKSVSATEMSIQDIRITLAMNDFLQAEFETFRPDDSKTEKGEYYSGTIQGIRWTTQEGNHKKIRAVVMADDGADPQVFMDKGRLHALFSSSLENSAGAASPFAENVKAEIKPGADGVDLIFTPKGITKAEKVILNSPRRIVFDFFYPEDAAIIGTSPAKADTSIQLPGQVSQTPSPAPAQSKKPDPVIATTPSPEPPKVPATMTRPSTITIPTSQQAAERLGRIPSLSNGRKTIVIDPGHGGKDPGAMDNGVMEKDVNLAVGLELQRALTAKGYNVIMTRATDVYLKLQERTDIANDAKADLFVSVHVNALPNKKSMTGFEIYIMALPTDKDAMNLAKIENREYVEGKSMDTANVDRGTEMLLRILGDMQQNNKISESTDFAAMLYNAGVRNGLPMRRVAQAPFFVLRGAGMPAVLLEIGFVTNANESRLLTTQAYQQRIADAMSEGIANYIR